MITTALLVLIAIMAFIQPNAPRMYAALLFVGLTIFHELFFSHLYGILYYGSAALLDLGIIMLASGISPIPRMVITLNRICLASIVVNFAGWVIWSSYLPPMAYDLAFVVIYLWALITLIKRDGSDVRDFSVGGWSSCFRFNPDTGLLVRFKHEGQA